MEKTVCLLLFIVAASSLSNGVKVNAKARETLSEIDKKLKLINKPAVKSIKVWHTINIEILSSSKLGRPFCIKESKSD